MAAKTSSLRAVPVPAPRSDPQRRAAALAKKQQELSVSFAAEGVDVYADQKWKEADWQKLVEDLIGEGLVKWSEVAACVLGDLNPPQVATSLATNKNFQAKYGKGTTWQAVKDWFYSQPLGCRQCGTLVKLEAEHIKDRILLGAAADDLANMQLLCKRCNAKKRPSHLLAGKTFLTAEAALMWLLFTFRPPDYERFKALCRAYGLTMSDQRFQEAWAMAVWLKKAKRYP